jgi:hypothetical protein
MKQSNLKYKNFFNKKNVQFSVWIKNKSGAKLNEKVCCKNFGDQKTFGLGKNSLKENEMKKFV